MKRFTLIIDGHNFYYRSLWSTFRQTNGKKVLSTKKDIDTFEKKLMTDFCSVIKQVDSFVTDVVFVVDSHSWRKDLLLQQEYKGNRKKVNDDIDKVGFLTSTGNFADTLKSMGVKISCVDRSEGDDLIYAWSDYLFENGVSSLILSTDRDLNQLLKCVDGVHIIQYSPVQNKLFVSKETNMYLSKINERHYSYQENLFSEVFTVSVENNSFDKFVESTVVEEVDPEKVRFSKIVGGDVSDNIRSVYYRRGDGTSRGRGLGEKTVEKIYNEFKNRIGCDFNYHIYGQEDVIKLLCNVIYDVVKINDESFTRRMLFENIKTNASLVSLTSESIPDYVIQDMKVNILTESSKKPISTSKITREYIFSKSRFKDYKLSIQIDSNTIKGVTDDDMSFIKG